jgi:ABC-type nickel/cobalt efflux system permease component RcnA
LDLSADQEEIREREKEKEKEREKERKTLLAKTIFYGARSENSPSQSQVRTSGNEPPPTLPLFVVLCYLLVLGGRVEGGGSVDRNFVCALAGQAMGLWESYRPRPRSHDYDHDHNHEHEHEHEHEHDYDWNLDEEGTSTIDTESDVEDMDHVLACLMQIVCLVRDGAGAGARGKSTGGMQGIFPLVRVFFFLSFFFVG